MELFWSIFLKILPLYGLMCLGYIAGKVAGVHRESVARILLYILSPIIVFHGAVTADLSAGSFALPTMLAALSCVLAVIAFLVGSKIWRDGTANIFAYAAASGNTGYFGIPVTIAVLGEHALSAAVLCTMGLILFENSVGFYYVARGSFTAKESIRRLATLPSIHALILGGAINIMGVDLPATYDTFIGNARGAYTILGSMMVGLGMTGLQRLVLDGRFLSLSIGAKFIVTPLATCGLVWLDAHTFQLLTPLMQDAARLLSLMPIATNTVVLASALNVQPGKAAVAVITSTLLALLIIPLMLSML